MSTVYNVNQKYRINVSFDLTVSKIIDHFPNLEGLIFDLLKDNDLINEILRDNLEKIKGQYSIDTTSFDWAEVSIDNTEISNILKK